MMTLNFFNALHYTGKTEAVLTVTFLADRLNDQYYIKLYNVNSFYVEVFFDDQNHLITPFRAFDDTTFLLTYLDELKIAV